MKRFPVGSSVNIDLECRDPDTGQLADPGGSIVCKVETPAGVITTYTFGSSANLVKRAVGRFRCVVPIPSVNQWNYRWETTLPTLANNGSFLVVPSDV